MNHLILLIICAFFLTGCKQTVIREVVPRQFSNQDIADHSALPAYSAANRLQAVIEIPAGTNLKIEYNNELKKFVADQIDGKDRVVEYLPYPGNYGFIPSTYMDPANGGDGDALDVLVLSESVPTGTVMEILPIALFGMTDDGEIDHKVIAIPADTILQTIKLKDYNDLNTTELKAKFIVQYWFESYKKNTKIENVRWQDTPATIREINKWLTK